MTIDLNKNEVQWLRERLEEMPKEIKYDRAKSILKKLTKSPISVASRKAKGREFQKVCASLIADAIGETFDTTKEGKDNSLIQVREGSLNGTDVILRGRALEKFPFSIECKKQEQITLLPWIEQAYANSTNEKPLFLIFTNKKLHDIFVCLMARDFFDIVKRSLEK